MKLAIPLLVAISVFGCASVAVTSDALEDRTAFALGLKKDDFTISNRQDSGVRTDYSVQTKSGAQYNCYVTGTVTVIGRTVSDAICSPMKMVGKSAGKKTTAPSSSCNALLKAANKC